MKSILSHNNLYTSLSNQTEIRYFYFNLFKTEKYNCHKILFDIACVLGAPFQKNTLEHIYKKLTDENNFSDVFKYLSGKDYFLKNEQNLHFTNPEEVRNSFYKNIDTETRKTLHEISAEALENSGIIKDKKYFDDIIYHYSCSGNDLMLKRCLWNAANYYISKYDYVNANTVYYRLLEYAESEEEKFDLITKIADVYRNAGEWDEEIKILRNYIYVFHNKYYQLSILIRTAVVYRIKSEYQKSLRILYRAYKIAEDNNFTDLALRIMLESAKIKLNKGNHKEALKELDEIIKISDENVLDEILRTKAVTLTKLGNFHEALKIYDFLFFKAEQNKNKILITSILMNLSEILMFKGNYNESYEKLRVGYYYSNQTGIKFDKAAIIGNMATIDLLKKNYNESFKKFRKQVFLFKEIGNRSGIARAYGMIAAINISIGKYSKALSYLIKQLSIVKSIRRKLSESICLGNIGLVYDLQGEFDNALKFFKKQLEIDEYYGNAEGKFRGFTNIGIQYFQLKSYSKCLTKIGAALKLSEKYGFKPGLDIALEYYCCALYELGKYEKCLEYLNSAIDTTFNNENFTGNIKCKILKEKVFLKLKRKKVKEVLNNIYNFIRINKDLESKAIIFYEIYKIEQESKLGNYEKNKLISLNIYKTLFKKTHNYQYNLKISELTI